MLVILIESKDPNTGVISVRPRYGSEYGNIGYYFMKYDKR